jgi:phage N-6-adenine-methyltransferase
MKGQDILFSKKSDLWETPQWLFVQLNSEFNFNLDPCATAETAKCKTFYTIEDDGLSKSWINQSVFINPPYSQTAKWVKKAFEAAKYENAFCAVLMPARTDTKYFHEYCMKAAEIRLIKGRLKFGESKNSAPFPSMVVIFNEQKPFHRLIGFPKISTMNNKP